MSLVSGNPVVTGTTATSIWANNTMSDIATELTDSLDRSGKGSMLAALSLNAGASVAAPDLTWNGDADTGLYRSAANSVALACGGSKIVEVTTTSFSVALSSALTVTAALVTVATEALIGVSKLVVDTANNLIKTAASNSGVEIRGNRSAADTGTDVVSNSTATRTAGNLHDFRNNTTSKLSVSFAGQLLWPSGPSATATSPAPSAVTAVTPNAHWAGGDGLAYWKDPSGIVRFKGRCDPDGSGANPAFTLPAGFRPNTGGDARKFACATSTSGVVRLVSITDAGAVQMDTLTAASVWFDSISFLAEQ